MDTNMEIDLMIETLLATNIVIDFYGLPDL